MGRPTDQRHRNLDRVFVLRFQMLLLRELAKGSCWLGRAWWFPFTCG